MGCGTKLNGRSPSYALSSWPILNGTGPSEGGAGVVFVVSLLKIRAGDGVSEPENNKHLPINLYIYIYIHLYTYIYIYIYYHYMISGAAPFFL
jgi:hypothetical protein